MNYINDFCSRDTLRSFFLFCNRGERLHRKPWKSYTPSTEDIDILKQKCNPLFYQSFFNTSSVVLLILIFRDLFNNYLNE